MHSADVVLQVFLHAEPFATDLARPGPVIPDTDLNNFNSTILNKKLVLSTLTLSAQTRLTWVAPGTCSS